MMIDLPYDTTSGFNGILGLDWLHLSGDRVVVRFGVTDRLKQTYGIVHGGVYCSVVEAMCSTGAAAWAMERGIAGVVGMSNTTSFIRAHRDGDLEAVATPMHQGRTYQLWEATISRVIDEKPVAFGQLRIQHIDDPAAVGTPVANR